LGAGAGAGRRPGRRGERGARGLWRARLVRAGSVPGAPGRGCAETALSLPPDALEQPLAQAPEAWAQALGISREAVALFAASEVIDLHIDSFIWTRVFGYDIGQRHQPRFGRGYFYNQVDVPRLRSVGISGATWVITTNPLRAGSARARVFAENLLRLRELLAAQPEVAVVRTHAEYLDARRAGKHAAFLGIQGGNALDAHTDLRALLAEGWLLRVTLVHLSSSALGDTSSPLRLGAA